MTKRDLRCGISHVLKYFRKAYSLLEICPSTMLQKTYKPSPPWQRAYIRKEVHRAFLLQVLTIYETGHNIGIPLALILPKLPTIEDLENNLSYSFFSTASAESCYHSEHICDVLNAPDPWTHRVIGNLCGHTIRHEMNHIQTDSATTVIKDMGQDFCFACELRWENINRALIEEAKHIFSCPLERHERIRVRNYVTARCVYENELSWRSSLRALSQGQDGIKRPPKARFADQEHRDEKDYRRNHHFRRRAQEYTPDVKRWADTSGNGFENTSWCTVSWQKLESQLLSMKLEALKARFACSQPLALEVPFSPPRIEADENAGHQEHSSNPITTLATQRSSSTKRSLEPSDSYESTQPALLVPENNSHPTKRRKPVCFLIPDLATRLTFSTEPMSICFSPSSEEGSELKSELNQEAHDGTREQ